MKKRLIVLVLALFVAACQPQVITTSFLIFLVADGRETTYSLDEPTTVEEFLANSDVNIRVGETDRLTPPRFTQLNDGMKITIVRVSESNECENEVIPFNREVIQNEGLQPDEELIAQTGQNGSQQVCYRITVEDGVATDRVPAGAPTVLTAPINEIMYVGVSTNVEPIPLVGTLAYINNSNAWIMIGNSTSKRPLTNTSNLDSLVLSLSADGQYLLYTAKSDDPEFVNELWLLRTTPNALPVKLNPTNVVTAEWIPGRANTFSYSTSEPQSIFPYWRSFNNLLTMEIDPNTGDALNNSIIVPESGGGLLGWWGTVYKWSPDGQTLAYARAESLGIVDSEGALRPLLNYTFFRTTQNWSWRANISWSPDSTLLATTSHGAPLGSEPADTSPVFNVVVTDRDGRFEADIQDSAGIWSSPLFSPTVSGDTQTTSGLLAYLRSREPYNSINGEYDLVVSDRDGSNARAIFPASTQPGITTEDFGLTPQDFAWSPDSSQIAVIYQGNLWVVDVSSGVSHQLSFDGQSQHPTWTY